MNPTLETLITAFNDAQAAAQPHATSEDGGTCNFDCAVFRLNGLRRSTIEKASQESGVDVDVRKWFGKSYAFVNVGHGQGNRRTRMAEAAAQALKHHRLEACVYYQMD